MKIVISADVSNMVAGFKKAEITIGDLEVSLKELKRQLREASGEDILRLNQQIKGMEDALKQAKTAGLEPAVSGLGKLGKGAEEAFSAVRKLAYILPGIGVAGLFDLAFTGISKLVEGSRALEKELEKVLSQFKSVKEIANASSSSQAGDIERIRDLARAVNDSSLSYEQQNNALTLLKESNKAYFGDLTKGTATVETLAKRTNEYAEALINTAIVKGFVESIAKATEEYNKQKDVLDKLALTRQRQQELSQKEAANNAKNKDIFGGAGAGVSGGTEQATALKKINDQFLAQRDLVESVSTVLGQYKGSLNQALQEGLKFKPLKDLPGGKSKAPEEKPLFPIFIRPDLQSQPQDVDESVKDFADSHDKAFKEAFKKLPHIDVKFPPVKLTGLDKALKEINDKIRSTVADSFEAVGEGLGDLLSGSGIGGFVNNLGRVLGEAFKQIGKILIQAGVEMLAIQDALKALKVTPEVAIIAGIAAIALGSLIENATAKKIGATAFASGGVVTGPTLGLVGEAGPEVIFPLEKLNQFIRGANTNTNVNVGGQLRVQGTDLVTVINRQNKLNGLSS